MAARRAKAEAGGPASRRWRIRSAHAHEQHGQPGQAVHVPGIYDLEVDTSVLRPEACAERIRHHLEAGPPASAFERLAAMATE